jgi:hypothetical protein
MRAWHVRAIEALTAVDGAVVTRWDRVAPGRSAVTTDLGRGARQVVSVPDALRSLREADTGSVDVLLDLTDGSVDLEVVDGPTSAETWHFVYGHDMDRDPVHAALLDYIRTPGRTQVALVTKPTGRILRQGLLTCRREEQLERMLLDPSGWPASEAVGRIRDAEDDSDSADEGLSTRLPAAVEDSTRTSAVPTTVLRVAALGRRGLKMKDALTRHDDWNIGVVNAPIAAVVEAGASQPISWFDLRPGRFAADPFGIERDGRLHVFFEDYGQREGRGTIAHTELLEGGGWSPIDTVLDPGVHASYPYLVEDDGILYMLPETAAANELVLYQSTDFPHGWRRAATLLAGIPVVDASVVKFEDRWWMFGTLGNRGAAHNLFIWHAAALTGPWTPHKGNPVKTDARSARPGGTPYVVDGVLFRPAQDCSWTYGGGLTVCRVDHLRPDRFQETSVTSLRARPGSPQPDGLHTLSGVGRRTLVDGKTRHLVPGVLQRTLEARFAPIGRLAGR